MRIEMQIKNNFFLPEGKRKLRFSLLIKRPFRSVWDYSGYTFICTRFICATIFKTKVIILICINVCLKTKKEAATWVQSYPTWPTF